VFDVEISRYRRPGCHHRVEPPDPFPPHQQFGFVVISRAIHLRMLGLSVAKVVDCLEEAHGVHVSPAAVLKMEHWAAEALGPLYESLKEQVRHVPAVHADETSFRIHGENGWLWVFVHVTAVVYRIAPSRGQDVLREVLEGFEGTLVRDAWDPYNCVTTADHQLDLLHINRWLEWAEVLHRVEPRPMLKVVDAKLTSAGHPPDEFLGFADRLRALLRESVLWIEAHPDASGRARRRIHQGARRALAHLVLHDWRDRDAARISKELWSKRRMVFTFLRKPGVSWHNNLAENHVRQGGALPQDQRGPPLVDGSLGTRAVDDGLPDVPGARAELRRSRAGRIAGEGLPGVRRSVSLTRKLNGYHPRPFQWRATADSILAKVRWNRLNVELAGAAH
jgi:transposase